MNLNNELYVNATQNRVGIGTSSPDEKLEVLGNTKITGDITLSGRVLGSTSGNINMIAAARGRVNSLGQAGTGSSSNFTPSRTSKGHYRVDSPVITPSSTVLITFYTGNAQMLSSVTTYTGYFTVHVKDGFGGFVDEDAGFHFVVF